MASSEYLWLQEHYGDLCEKYPGKIVAIVDHELIAVGDTFSEVARQAEEITDKEPLFGKIRKKRAMIL